MLDNIEKRCGLCEGGDFYNVDHELIGEGVDNQGNVVRLCHCRRIKVDENNIKTGGLR